MVKVWVDLMRIFLHAQGVKEVMEIVRHAGHVNEVQMLPLLVG